MPLAYSRPELAGSVQKIHLYLDLLEQEFPEHLFLLVAGWKSDIKQYFSIRTLICLTVQTEQAKWFNRLQNCSVIFTHCCELLWISILFVSSQHQQLLTYAHIRNISLDDSFISYQNQSCHIDWVSHSLYDQADHSCAALVDNKVSLPQEPQRGRLWCSARDGQSQNQPS